MPEQEKKQYKALMSLTSMGFATVISTLLGFWFGLYLDGVFGTTPWLMLLFLILGVIAGFRNIYMTIKKSGF
ncbi:MAG TPA: AtpZ/AtpI family protein [Thermodesulfobacteriota bacterium]|nr:AtpZ/AtpI family protein [Thermodesulfobacteriota bacterium]